MSMWLLSLYEDMIEEGDMTCPYMDIAITGYKPVFLTVAVVVPPPGGFCLWPCQ